MFLVQFPAPGDKNQMLSVYSILNGNILHIKHTSSYCICHALEINSTYMRAEGTKGELRNCNSKKSEKNNWLED